MLLARESLVDSREFQVPVVLAFHMHGALGEVDRPAIQLTLGIAGSQHVLGEHRVIPHEVDHDDLRTVAHFGVPVERMEDIARVDLEPAHGGMPGGVIAFARHDTDSGRVLGVPRIRNGRRLARVLTGLGRDGAGNLDLADKRVHHDLSRLAQQPWHRHRLADHRHVQRDRQIVENDVLLGEGEVVHHRRAVHLDVDGAAGTAMGVDHGVLNRAATGERV
ncbi:Uncharacterised protein [Mycobacteroides abscessus subsp. abscessus]|nr:Uncharacterised protein [Mycobacteroides abscessus subsp. abscessus]